LNLRLLSAFIDGRNMSFKEFFNIKGDAKGFEDVGDQVGVRQGEISRQVANSGHVLKDKLCKISRVTIEDRWS